jgi:hypothetical protein
MTHPTEEQLILYYYGEESEPGIDRHLAGCEGCRHEYRNLQRVLNTVETLPVPERGADYAARVWSRLEPQLGGRRTSWWRGWFEWRRLSLAGGMAAVIVLAFLAGRFAQRPVEKPLAAAPVRERILLVAVGDHLERSQMVLAEIVNAGGAGKGKIDLRYEQRAAQDLVDSNRLFRLSAVKNGDTATAAVLDELERVLLEISHSPSDLSSTELDDLRRQIEERGILFKVRVFATRVRDRERQATVQNL